MARGKAAKKKRAAEMAAAARKKAAEEAKAAEDAALAAKGASEDPSPEEDGVTADKAASVSPGGSSAEGTTAGGSDAAASTAGATDGAGAPAVWGAAKKVAAEPPAPPAVATGAEAPAASTDAAAGATAASGGGAGGSGGHDYGVVVLEDEESKSLVLHNETTARLVAGITVNTSTREDSIHPNAKDISVSNMTMNLFGATLLNDTDLVLNWGQRYGLLGPNGCGKSTLMHMLGRRMVPIPSNIDSFHVVAEVDASNLTALEAVMEVDVERRALEEEAELIGDKLDDPEFGDEYAERLNDIYERLDEMEAETAEARAAQLLHGLGFTKAMQAKATKDFSGGWRMRIALARALFLNPSFLMLDEPTNHLDMEAVVWLEGYLAKFKKILLMVSHSQDFLNNVCTNIIHMHQEKLNYYGGNYDSYVATRKEKEDHQRKRWQWEQDQIKQMKGYIAKFGHGSKKMAKQAQSKEKTLAKMERGGLTAKVVDDRVMTMRFPDCGKIAPPVLMLQEMSFGYTEDNLLYENVDFGVDLDSRIALVGPNGAGKTTLLKLICGELVPTHGNVRPNAHLRIARYTQHFVDSLDMEQDALGYIMSLHNEPKETMRRYLGRFGVTGKMQTTKMAFMSDGMKSRVVFALMAYKTPHMLLLDEPTNHLDMETIDALAEGINEFEGGMLLVSHDMRLISQVAKEIWICDEKTITRWPGTITEYKEHLRAKIAKLQESEAAA